MNGAPALPKPDTYEPTAKALQAIDDVTGEAIERAADTVVQVLLSCAAGRRALSKQSPVFFDSYYCGMRYAKHREAWLETLWGMRKEAKAAGTKGKLLLLAPRDHGKTEAFISFVAGLIAEDRNIRILWVSETVGVGKKRLGRVKNLLESERFQEDWCSAPDEGFGPLNTGAEKWTETMFYVARSKASVDPTFEVAGIGGAITGGHFDVILFDDVETTKTVYTAAQRAKTRSWYTETVLPMLSAGGQLGIIGCLTADTPILMSDGTWKPIVDVNEGEMVWSIDERGTSGPRRVEARLDQGVADVLHVKTARHRVKATPWHPFLTTRDGRLQWTRADALTADDYLVSVKEIPGEIPEDYPWLEEDFCWMMGFLYGDGWAYQDKNVCVALKVDQTINAKILAALEKWFPICRFWMTPFGYIRGDCRAVVRGLRGMGFEGNAKTKRIPAWVFRTPPAMRIAFLRGVCASDGSPNVGEKSGSSKDGTKENASAFRIELSNKELTQDLRRLSLTCGVRPGDLLFRARMIKAPHSKEAILSETWSTSLNFNWTARMETAAQEGKAPAGEAKYKDRVRAAAIAGPGFRLDRVTSVEPAGQEQVWDLTVEGTHAFIADGLAVHNTRKHYDDLYAHRLEDSTFDVIEDKAILRWPEVVDPVSGQASEGWKYLYKRDKRGRLKCEGVDLLAPAEVLWPEERSIRYLLMERQGSTPTAFGREFQHEVVDDSTAPFKNADIERARDRGNAFELLSGGRSEGRMAAWASWQALGVKLIDVVQCWDLALTLDAKKAETADTDYTVGLTIGKDIDGNRYLLGIARFRGVLPSQLRDKVKGEFLRFVSLGIRPRVVAVEHNAFGSIHFLGLQKTTDLPLRPHQTTQAKADPWEGVPSLGMLFENGKFVLPCLTDEDRAAIQPLCDELHGLGREAHDDTVLAMWIGELQLREDPFSHAMSFGDGEIVTSNPTGAVTTESLPDPRKRLLPGEKVPGQPEPEQRSLTDEDIGRDMWDSLGL